MAKHTLPELSSTGPSPHLSWTELACHDAVRTPYPLKWRETRAPAVGRVFEAIREACDDRPISVLSGYRTWEWNRIMPGGPGSRRSWHPEGRGIDIRPPGLMHLARFHEIILWLAPLTEIGGIGLYATFVHVDTRETDRLARWHGSRRKADS